MTEQDTIAAAEADRLRQDPAFQGAVIAIRKEALEELASVDSTDVESIRTLQARVRAIDLLATEIGRIILRGTPQRKPSVA